MAVSQHFIMAGQTDKAVLNEACRKGIMTVPSPDPAALITSSAAKLGFTKDYLAMVQLQNKYYS